MKVTKSYIKQLVKEELNIVLNEMGSYEDYSSFDRSIISPSEINQFLKDNPEILSSPEQKLHYVFLKPTKLEKLGISVVKAAVGSISGKEELRKVRQMANGYSAGSLEQAKIAAFRMSQKANEEAREKFKSNVAGSMYADKQMDMFDNELLSVVGDAESVELV